MAKRKIHSGTTSRPPITTKQISVPSYDDEPPLKRRASQRKVSQTKRISTSTDPNKNVHILDAAEALRASPDADEPDERLNVGRAGIDVPTQVKEEDKDISLMDSGDSDSALSDLPDVESPIKAEKAEPKLGKRKDSQGQNLALVKKAKENPNDSQFLDPNAEEDEEAGEEEIQAALSRPPPVNSDYLPLPWKGRLGYVRQATVS